MELRLSDGTVESFLRTSQSSNSSNTGCYNIDKLKHVLNLIPDIGSLQVMILNSSKYFFLKFIFSPFEFPLKMYLLLSIIYAILPTDET